MAYSYVRYTGNGSTTNYTFPFQYLSQDNIKVRIDGVSTPLFSLLNANTVQMFSAPAIGSVIEIRRETPKDNPIVNFTDGSVLLERDLDLLVLWDLYTSQESADLSGDVINVGADGRWNARNLKIGSLSPATADDEAVNKGQLDYEYPAVNTVAGSISEVNVVASDLGAAVTLTTDLGSVTDPILTTPGVGSSNIVTVANNIASVNTAAANIAVIQASPGNAAAAAASATDAAISAASALSSKNAAASSQTSAASSATSAAGSATTATTKASEASASATTATTKASEAATSATNAASSATSASTSASTATTQASAASSSASSAATSATAASGSASAASTSASNAASSATAAATSASNASSSASSASTSATNAASSATAASGSATTASTQATNAASSASAAATSATNAASSATSASSSASSASTSATNAATSLFNFRAQYLGPLSSAPTVDGNGNAVTTGDLYFDTAQLVMRVYNGTGWQNASSSVNGTAARFRYIATAGQTVFSGSDSNGNTLSYDPGYIDVYLNGVRLDSTDITASSGTSITLLSAATVGDELNIIAFGTFVLASLPGTSIVSGTVGTSQLANGAVTDSKLADIDLGVLP